MKTKEGNRQTKRGKAMIDMHTYTFKQRGRERERWGEVEWVFS